MGQGRSGFSFNSRDVDLAHLNSVWAYDETHQKAHEDFEGIGRIGRGCLKTCMAFSCSSCYSMPAAAAAITSLRLAGIIDFWCHPSTTESVKSCNDVAHSADKNRPLSVCLTVYLPLCLCLSLSSDPPFSLSICFCLSLSLTLSLYLSVSLSLCLSLFGILFDVLKVINNDDVKLNLVDYLQRQQLQ